MGPDIAEKLIFVDESHKSVKEMRRGRHWVLKGRGQPFIEAPFFGDNRDIRYSLIGVCDINGFVQESCEVIMTTGSGEDVGPINRERFEQWVEEKLVPVHGNYANGHPRSVVVLDNATIHHSDRIRNLVMNAGAVLLYLPPYSPDLSPIELMFSSYKKCIMRLGRNHDWWTSHFLALDEIHPHTARNYFRHCHITCNDIIINDEYLKMQEEECIATAFLFILIQSDLNNNL